MLAYRDLQQSKLKHLKIQKKFMIMEHQYQNQGNIFSVDLNSLKEQSKKLENDLLNLQNRQKECEDQKGSLHSELQELHKMVPNYSQAKRDFENYQNDIMNSLQNQHSSSLKRKLELRTRMRNLSNLRDENKGLAEYSDTIKKKNHVNYITPSQSNSVLPSIRATRNGASSVMMSEKHFEKRSSSVIGDKLINPVPENPI